MLEAKDNKMENKFVLFEGGESKGLDPNAILLAEFNYAAQTAFQANEDRVRVFGFIVANIATIIAAFIAPVISSQINPQIFGLIFLILAFVGLFFLFQLSRLRTAWIQSIKAMNQIKDFYIKNVKNLELQEAFKWKSNTIPSGNKVGSLAFLLSITISLLTSLSLALAIFIFSFNVPFAIIGGIVFLLFQTILWFWLTK